MNYAEFNQSYVMNDSVENKKNVVSGQIKKKSQYVSRRDISSKITPEDNERAIMMTKGIISGVDGIDEDNVNLDPVTVMFFSQNNFKRIQKMIRSEILNRTEGKYNLKGDKDD